MGSRLRFYFALLVLVFAMGCEGKFDADPFEAFGVTLIAPADSEVCNVSLLDSGDLSVQFQWAVDGTFGGDFTLTYTNTVTGNTETLIVQGGQQSANLTLEPGVRYTWNVSAISNGDIITAENDFVTVTPGLQNTSHPPYLSDITITSQGGGAFLLDYLAIDPDLDPIVYDVFLDTQNPPVAQIEGNSSVTQVQVNLSPSTLYYIRVVAKDGTGNETSASRSYTTP